MAIFLDDILLTGKDDEEHLQTLVLVLKRLQEAGLRLKITKCSFMSEEVMFLGHKEDNDRRPIDRSLPNYYQTF